MGKGKDKYVGAREFEVALSSGELFDLTDPDPNQISIEEIARTLSRLARYGGRTRRFYSVAEHCVWCCELARRVEDSGECLGLLRAVLMHDAAETYVGDVVRPIKKALPEFDKIESRVMTAVQVRFNLRCYKGVKTYDDWALRAEKEWLFGGCDKWEGLNKIELPDVELPQLRGLVPATAEREFLRAVDELGIVEH